MLQLGRRGLIFSFTLLFLTVLALITKYESSFVLDQAPVQADVIIVLGCSVANDGTPSRCMQSRVTKAFALWQAGYAQNLIVTGAAVRNRFVEAQVMHGLLRSRGVPSKNIIIEANSRNTKMNADLSAQLMREHHWQRALVVTSPHHTTRAARLFVKQKDIQIAAMVASESVWNLSLRSRVLAVLHEIGANRLSSR